MKILLIQLRRIGDVLMTTPAVRALRNRYNEAEIHFLTEIPADEIYNNNPYVNKVIAVSSKLNILEKLSLIKKLRKENYDIIIDFFSNPTSCIYTFLSKGKKSIGVKKGLRSFLYDKRVELKINGYSALNKLEMIKDFDIDKADCKLDFFISENDKNTAKNILETLGVSNSDFLVTVSPVSRQEYKVWPPENFAKVCDYLIQRYKAKIFFIFGPGEKHFVDNVLNNMTEEKPEIYTDILSISVTKGIFEHSNLHVGNDNGPMHFAISAGIPTIAIFGKPKAKNWTPPDSKSNIALEYDPGCKSNCTWPNCQLECLTGIKPEQVYDSIDKIINRESFKG